MNRLAVAVLAVVLAVATSARAEDKKPETKGQIGHMVFFKLKDATPESRQKLVDACTKYLSTHEGTAHFSAGVIGEEFNRDVNDREWDVALHLVFESKAAHDKYQDHAGHKKFIDENKDGWAKVRVFDSIIAPAKKK